MIRLIDFHSGIKKKILSVITLYLFIVSNVYPDISRSDTGSFPSIDKSFEQQTFITLPRRLGKITASHNAHSDKLVIHIQDAHCNYFAQKQIAAILSYIDQTYAITCINLEGGVKEYDLSPFTVIQDSQIRRRVSDFFVREGTLSGAEYFAVNNPDNARLWGIEDKELYLKNLNVYKNSVVERNRINESLFRLENILLEAKETFYSKDLSEFENIRNAYKKDSLPLKDYLFYLTGTAKSAGFDTKKVKNIHLLMQCTLYEDNVDFKKINQERELFINALKRALSKRRLETVLHKTLELKQGLLSQHAYHVFLIKQAHDANVSLKPFPEFRRYMRYTSLYNTIDFDLFNHELYRLEQTIGKKMCRDETQETIYTFSNYSAFLANLFGFTLTKKEYDDYTNTKPYNDLSEMISLLMDTPALYPIAREIEASLSACDLFRKGIEPFYNYSMERDKHFLKNMRFSKTRAFTEHASGKDRQAAIIITGGFHSEHLLNLFKQEGVSYVSILPQFESPKGYTTNYFDLLAGGKSPFLEKVRPLIPSMNMMQIASMLSRAISEDVWGKANLDVYRAAILIREQIAKGNPVVDIERDNNNVIFHIADRENVEMPVRVFLDMVHQRFIDTELEELDKDAYEDLENLELMLLEMADFLQKLNADAAIFDHVAALTEKNRHDRALVRFAHGISFRGHAGGEGIRLNGNLKRERGALKGALIHEIVAGLYGDHFLAQKVEQAYLRNDITRKLLQDITPFQKPVWHMSAEERLGVDRDYQSARARKQKGVYVFFAPHAQVEGKWPNNINPTFIALLLERMGKHLGEQFDSIKELCIEKLSYVRTGEHKHIIRIKAKADGVSKIFDLHMAFIKDDLMSRDAVEREAMREMLFSRVLDKCYSAGRGLQHVVHVEDLVYDNVITQSDTIYRKLFKANGICSLIISSMHTKERLDELEMIKMKERSYLEAIWQIMYGWVQVVNMEVQKLDLSHMTDNELVEFREEQEASLMIDASVAIYRMLKNASICKEMDEEAKDSGYEWIDMMYIFGILQGIELSTENIAKISGNGKTAILKQFLGQLSNVKELKKTLREYYGIADMAKHLERHRKPTSRKLTIRINQNVVIEGTWPEKLDVKQVCRLLCLLKDNMGEDFDNIEDLVILKMTYVGHGAFKHTIRVQGTADGKPKIFGLRLAFVNEQVKTASDVELVTENELKQFAIFDPADGVSIVVRHAVHIRELIQKGILNASDDLFRHLTGDNGIWSITIGEFAGELDLSKIDKTEMEEAYQNAIDTIVRGWLLTLRLDNIDSSDATRLSGVGSTSGIVIRDMRADNLAPRPDNDDDKKQPIVYIDLGCAAQYSLGDVLYLIAGLYYHSPMYRDRERQNKGSGDRWIERIILPKVFDTIERFLREEDKDTLLDGGMTVRELQDFYMRDPDGYIAELWESMRNIVKGRWELGARYVGRSQDAPRDELGPDQEMPMISSPHVRLQHDLKSGPKLVRIEESGEAQEKPKPSFQDTSSTPLFGDVDDKTRQEQRLEAVEAALSLVEGKDNIVKTIAGVPHDIVYQGVIESVVRDVNRKFAKAGFGLIEVSLTHEKGDKRQIITFPIYEASSRDEVESVVAETEKAYKNAVHNARQLLEQELAQAPEGTQGYIVLFAPQIDDLLLTRHVDKKDVTKGLAEWAYDDFRDDEQVIVLPDAYTDCQPKHNQFPDIDLRVVIARLITYARISAQNDNNAGVTSAWKAIDTLLRKAGTHKKGFPEELFEQFIRNQLTPRDFLGLLLKIEPIRFESIIEWGNAQRAIDTAA